MKALGIIRKIDGLGRIVLPKEVRDAQNWQAGQPIEMFMTKEGLLLKPYQSSEEKENVLKILDKVMAFAEQQPLGILKKELLEVIEYVEEK
jgi:AbrB family looped-hinge helix DNA binding protein